MTTQQIQEMRERGYSENVIVRLIEFSDHLNKTVLSESCPKCYALLIRRVGGYQEGPCNVGNPLTHNWVTYRCSADASHFLTADRYEPREGF